MQKGLLLGDIGVWERK